MSAPAEIKSANWFQGMINTVNGADGGVRVGFFAPTSGPAEARPETGPFW